jgi:hypothetical protein
MEEVNITANDKVTEDQEELHEEDVDKDSDTIIENNIDQIEDEDTVDVDAPINLDEPIMHDVDAPIVLDTPKKKRYIPIISPKTTQTQQSNCNSSEDKISRIDKRPPSYQEACKLCLLSIRVGSKSRLSCSCQ